MTCQKCPHCASIRAAKARAAVLAKPRPQRLKQADKKKAHRMSTSTIRAACMERAGGVCEHCMTISPQWGPLEMDHMLGGSGRRRARQSIETCWMLCGGCHRLKTRNEPTADYWRARMTAHCLHHDYPVPRFAEKILLRKAAHPSLSR